MRGTEAEERSTRGGGVLGRGVGGGGKPVVGSKSIAMCFEGFAFFLWDDLDHDKD